MVAILDFNTVNEPVLIPSREGTSPIGTTSPNTGSTAATNSSYAQGAFASGINTQAATSYTVQNTDYQGIVIFNTASAVAVTLNSAVNTNFACTILNLGTGAITLTPTSGTVNGVASLALLSGQGAQVFFSARNWLVYSGTAVLPSLVNQIVAGSGISISPVGGTGIVTITATGGTGVFGITMDGAGSPPTLGIKGYVTVPYNCTITGWSIIGNAVGSVQMALCFSAGATIPDPVTDIITDSTPITLASEQIAESTAVSAWATALTANGTLAFKLLSASGCTQISVQIQVSKP
jgi:hypothetical protein